MNEYELRNKLNCIYDALLDIKFHLNELETERKIKEVKQELEYKQDMLSNLNRMQSEYWMQRENAEKRFNETFKKFNEEEIEVMRG